MNECNKTLVQINARPSCVRRRMKYKLEKQLIQIDEGNPVQAKLGNLRRTTQRRPSFWRSFSWIIKEQGRLEMRPSRSVGGAYHRGNKKAEWKKNI
ncbi:hypothetical protein CEXT_355001 [Caerostris extrusa]|uniref:Uncharacterized protein n=1 Tax=Caerostris extrusa TaxID=172846 RepID=A0AAV4UQI5_CAEEX|nr:hypothetical protein CEXT_355001 [Caerostris extrusa]